MQEFKVVPLSEYEYSPTMISTGINYGLSDYAKDKSIPLSERMDNINRYYDNERKQIDNDLNKYLAKQYAGAALQIGSAAIPVGAGLRLGAGAIKALTPRFGKAIATEIGSGLAGGALGGAVEGFGRGLVEGENPFKTSLQDGSIGLITGGALGGAVGRVGQAMAKRNLPNNPAAQQQYFADYVEGLSNNAPLGQISRFDKGLADFRTAKEGTVKGVLNNGNTQVLYDTPDDFIDLTNSFDSTPTMEEVKNFLRESAKTGKKFETSSPDYFLDVLDSSKKIDHIAKSSNFKTMNKSQKKRHNKYVLAFDDISKTLKKNGEGVENTKPDKKPNVKNYHEFNTTAKFNENNYPLTVYAEQLINEPDTIPQTYHLYDILENKKSPSANSLKSVNLGDDINIMTDNLDNVNPSA